MNELSAIFLKVVNMSLTASVAIAAVLLLRLLLRKAPKLYSYVLWGVVLFRLLCPVSVNSEISLLGLTGVTANHSGEMEYPFVSKPVEAAGNGVGLGERTGIGNGIMPFAGEKNGAGLGEQSVNENAMAPSTSAGKEAGLGEQFGNENAMAPPTSAGKEAELGGRPIESKDGLYLEGGFGKLLSILSYAWLSGMAALGLYSVWSALRLRRKAACSMILRGNIYLADHIPSPFVLGLLRPKIYLPSSLSEREREYSILHEQRHIRRRDHLVKPLAFLALCLHWMNPLAWLAFALAMRDMEMSCDEAVVREIDKDARAEYAGALLHCAIGKRKVPGLPLAFGEGDAEKRILNIMRYKRPAAAVGIAAALACLALAACLATNPASGRERLNWAKKLSAEEVESIELVVMPQDREKQYKKFSAEELDGVVSLIRQSKGKYLASHEDMDGGSIFFYLTMKDGSKHQVGNMGNIYLYIDGDYYDAGYEWLSSWEQEYGEGNARLPKGFYEDGAEPAVSVTFQARILEADADRILVEPVEGSQELASADQISIPLEDAKLPEGAEVGDTVEIEYNGEIMESYPVQLGQVYRISLVEAEVSTRLGSQSAGASGQGENASQGASSQGENASQGASGQGNGATQGASGQGDGSSKGLPGQEGNAQSRVQQVDQEAYGAIWEAIMEYNGGVYEGTDEYDIACCSFANLETESAAPSIGRTDPRVTYYGWAYFGEYKFFETRIEEVSASHSPVALTFRLDEEEGYVLEEYWEPADGEDNERDIRGKFPPSVAEDGLDSEKFVRRQSQECYEQAIAGVQADTDPMVERLLDIICQKPGVSPSSEGSAALSSNPQDYIDFHIAEYWELGYFGDETLKYCLKRFHRGEETGLQGHIMAHACEDLLEERGWEIPLKASEAATGQEWYDALKAEAGNWGEREIKAEDELPLSVLKIGIPIEIMGNAGWIQDRKAIPSEEGHLKIQYEDTILEGQCTFWAAKGEELGLPDIKYDPSKEETWGGADAHGEFVEVRVQHTEDHMLASWEYQDYKFALTAEVPQGQMDRDVVAKTALNIIRQLE